MRPTNDIGAAVSCITSAWHHHGGNKPTLGNFADEVHCGGPSSESGGSRRSGSPGGKKKVAAGHLRHSPIDGGTPRQDLRLDHRGRFCPVQEATKRTLATQEEEHAEGAPLQGRPPPLPHHWTFSQRLSAPTGTPPCKRPRQENPKSVGHCEGG
ncbi:hypothetical protein NDU88_009653 [Pleurodeles waltl]|uniref:Uncharacterized protein n=1 Tax=Pleurodeles waltl TaxID=8319 RepID=A0AAV7QWD5_PLEWA|nr:hypothetical protein NDU88_009653 [Pleurodeles waltl]